MNAERFHSLINRIGRELTATNAVKNLAKLAAALEMVVSQSTAQSQQQLSATLSALRDGLQKSELTSWSPAWLDLLREVGAADILGQNLLDRVNNIISMNAITPAVAHEEIAEIHKRIESLREAIVAGENSFEFFKIGSEELEPGECEIGFLIPRRAVENELGNLSEELDELNFILRTVTEVATGEMHPAKVRNISSSDFLILLAQHSGEAALFATLMERLIAAYKRILEIRKLHGELSALVGDEALTEVATKAEAIMEKEVSAAAKDAIAKSPVKDSGRKNELRNALDSALRKLADRIDRGFNVEIRIEPLEENGVEAEASPEERKVYEKHRDVIERAAKQLEFSYRGGAPILHLDKPKPEKKQSRQKTPKPTG